MNYKKLSSGHNACAGCGQLVAAMAVMRGLENKEVIITNATGCLEVTTTAYPDSCWGIPWIHSLFENSSAVASGVRTALNHKFKNKIDKDIKVVAQGGDGATFDIGIGLISGMWERGDNVLYICYDTESYSNTGYQASGSSPYGSSTSTSPAGNHQIKKDMIGIALAHNLKYVAQSTAGFPDDITNKVKKALEVNGPSYIQILSPCVPGWNTKPDSAVKIGKLAVNTGLYPLLEYINGELSSSSKISTPTPVAEYLKTQGRFKNLNEDDINIIQSMADKNIKKYKLLNS